MRLYDGHIAIELLSLQCVYDYDKTKDILDNALSNIKSKVEIIPSHPERQILGLDKIHIQPPHADMIKKENFRKISHKKHHSAAKGSVKKQEGKKINEIKVPTDVPVLPVLKVELPKRTEVGKKS